MDEAKHISRIVNKLLPIPKRPFKNFAAFLDSYYWWKDAESYPCIYCAGKGFYYDPDDRDPIEGYKLATRHKCKTCKGEKTGPRREAYEHYAKYIEKWQDEKKATNEKRVTTTNVLSKLTPEDIESLFAVLSDQCGGLGGINIWHLRNLGKAK